MKLTLEPPAGDEPEVVIRGDPADPRVHRLMAAFSRASGAGRLFLYREGKAFLYGLEDVDYFEAGEGRVLAHAGAETLETRERLYELAGMAPGFIQISKGVLVNVARVRSVEAEFSGNYVCSLRDGKTRLTLSRKYVKAFKQYVMEAR